MLPRSKRRLGGSINVNHPNVYEYIDCLLLLIIGHGPSEPFTSGLGVVLATLMESLNLNTLASSLPTANLQNAEKDLLNNFKGIQISVKFWLEHGL